MSGVTTPENGDFDTLAQAGGVDEELLRLEASPAMTWRRWGTFLVMAFTAAAATCLALMLRLDVAYVFAPSTPHAIGNVLAADVSELPSNRFVRLEGAPMMSNAVYYEHAVGGDEFMAFCLAGQRDVWVQVPVSEGSHDAALARREFEGRLVQVRDLGTRFDSVRNYVTGTLHQPMDGDSWVLLADEEPSGSLWSILAVALVIGFVLVDAWLVLRWFKPLPVETEAPVAG